jgi:hypothetical protein
VELNEIFTAIALALISIAVVALATKAYAYLKVLDQKVAAEVGAATWNHLKDQAYLLVRSALDRADLGTEEQQKAFAKLLVAQAAAELNVSLTTAQVTALIDGIWNELKDRIQVLDTTALEATVSPALELPDEVVALLTALASNVKWEQLNKIARLLIMAAEQKKLGSGEERRDFVTALLPELTALFNIPVTTAQIDALVEGVLKEVKLEVSASLLPKTVVNNG